MTRGERCTRPAVRILCLHPPVCDEEGFRTHGPDPISVSWSEIVRVAYVYYMHPWALVDGNYWGLQAADPRISYWIEEAEGGAFDAHLRHRFEIGEVPLCGTYDTSDRSDIRAWIAWPPADVGKQMYTAVKRHWWSRPRLAYALD